MSGIGDTVEVADNLVGCWTCLNLANHGSGAISLLANYPSIMLNGASSRVLTLNTECLSITKLNVLSGTCSISS